jgi:hypothetical protein
MELIKRVQECTKPVITFDVEPILVQYDNILEKYKNMVFTDETVAGCKKTITELNSGKKEIEDFRKKVKVEMNEPIAEFERKCKMITEKIDTVTGPLKAQYECFETKRKAEREDQLNNLLIELIEPSGLKPKYSKRVELKPEYLNKTATVKSVSAEINAQIAVLLTAQNSEEEKRSMLEMIIESTNSVYNLGVKLQIEDFERIIDQEFKIIKDEVTAQAERRKTQEKEAVERIERAAQAKAELEAQKQIDQAELESKKSIELAHAEANKMVEVVTAVLDQFIPVESAPEEKTKTIKFEVDVTESQFEALKNYLACCGIKHSRIK